MNQLTESVVNVLKDLNGEIRISISKYLDFQSWLYLINEPTHGCVFFQDSHFGLWIITLSSK